MQCPKCKTRLRPSGVVLRCGWCGAWVPKPNAPIARPPVRSSMEHGERCSFAHRESLRPWDEVTELWNRRSGQNLTRARVWKIAQMAQRKIRRQLAGGGGV